MKKSFIFALNLAFLSSTVICCMLIADVAFAEDWGQTSSDSGSDSVSVSEITQISTPTSTPVNDTQVVSGTASESVDLPAVTEDVAEPVAEPEPDLLDPVVQDDPIEPIVEDELDAVVPENNDADAETNELEDETQVDEPETDEPEIDEPESEPVAPVVLQSSTVTSTDDVAENDEISASSVFVRLDNDLSNQVFDLLDEETRNQVLQALSTQNGDIEIELKINVKGPEESDDPDDPVPTNVVSTRSSGGWGGASSDFRISVQQSVSSVGTSTMSGGTASITSDWCGEECQNQLAELAEVQVAELPEYEGPTMSVCDEGCLYWLTDVSSTDGASGFVYVEPDQTLDEAVLDSLYEQNNDGVITSFFSGIWYAVPVIPELHAWATEGANGFGGGVINVTDGINNFVVDDFHARLGDKPFLSVAEFASDPLGAAGNGVDEFLEDPYKFLSDTGTRIEFAEYLFARGFVSGAAGTVEGLYTLGASPGKVINGVEFIFTDPVTATSVIANGIGTFVDESLNDSEKGFDNAGRLSFEILSLLVGPETKVGYASKTDEVGALAKITDNAAGYSDNLVTYSDDVGRYSGNVVTYSDEVGRYSDDISRYSDDIASPSFIDDFSSAANTAIIDPGRLTFEEQVSKYLTLRLPGNIIDIFIPDLSNPVDVGGTVSDIVDLDEAMKAVDDGKNYTISLLSGVVDGVSDTLNQVTSAVSEGVGSTVNNISNTLSNGVDTISNSIWSTPVNASNTLVSTNNTSSRSSSKSSSSKSSSSKSSSSKSSSSTNSSSTSTTSKSSSSTSSSSQSVTSSVSKAVSSATKTVSSAVSSVSKSVSSTVNKASSSVSSTVKSVTSSVSKAVSSTVNKVSSSVSSAAKTVTSTASKVVSSASKTVNSAIKSISSFFKF